jgi:hypothetical protein
VATPQKKGPGDHLHDVIRKWIGADFTDGCGCKQWIAKMNRGGAAWCRKNVKLICQKLNTAAQKRGMWKTFKQIPKARLAVIVVTHPMFTIRPIRCMVNEAIRRSEQDAQPNHVF